MDRNERISDTPGLPCAPKPLNYHAKGYFRQFTNRIGGSVDHLALKFQDSWNKSGGNGCAVPHCWSYLIEVDVVPLPVEDPHLLDSSVTVSKAISIEFQTFSNRQRTGSFNSAGTDI